jgi:hypothetical protein
MRANVEQKLIDARPETAETNKTFISQTLAAVQKASATETFERAIRTTNATKKERFIMRLKHIPRSTSIGLATAAVLLCSGTAFAAYQLWLSPSARVQSIQHTVKGEQALLKLKGCYQLGASATITINPQSGLNAKQGADVIQAYCETNAVQQWAMNALHVETSEILLPYTITAMHGSTVDVAYQGDTRTMTLTPTTLYVSGGLYVSHSALKVGDSVAYVATANNAPAKAVIKLDLDSSYYSTAMQRAIILHEPCAGNPGDLCSSGAGISGIELRSYGEAGANPDATGDWKTIEGKLVSYSDATITLEASSRATYTVNTTGNLIDGFNAQPNSNYGDISIATGDTLQISYRQSASAEAHTIASDELENVTLLVTGNLKIGAIQKY